MQQVIKIAENELFDSSLASRFDSSRLSLLILPLIRDLHSFVLCYDVYN